MKRLLDILVSGLLLILLSPLFLIVSLLICCLDGFPIFFLQERSGRFFMPFRIIKFRTMRTSRSGPLVTASSDTRTTNLGRWLRSTKIDELPQLWNVFMGDMSLVGPRPEIPFFTEHYEQLFQEILKVRPGITDWTSLQLIDEASLLGSKPDPEKFYLEVLLPRKAAWQILYARGTSLHEDFCILWWTARSLAVSSNREPLRQRLMKRPEYAKLLQEESDLHVSHSC